MPSSTASTSTRQTRRRLVSVLLVVLLIGAVASIPEHARRREMPVPVRTDVVAEQTVEEVIGATAETEASEIASIWSGLGLVLKELPVVVKAVHVEGGEFVEKNEVMIELEDELFLQAVKQKEAALSAARLELDATRQLHEDRVASALELREAILNVELAKLDLELAEFDLERCKVRSPIEGYVGDVLASIGEQVGFGKEFSRVYRLDPIHVRVDFPQERIDGLSLGQEAEIVLDSFPQETFRGKVVRIFPQAEVETRTLPVVVEMPNPDHRIKGGISGYARLRVSRRAVTVPATAVIQHTNKAMVFSVENGRARMNVFRTGPAVDTGVLEVRDGLTVGQEVVVYGQDSLEDNDPVDVEWRSERE